MKNGLVDDVTIVTREFVDLVVGTLGTKLYGIYMYGASMFDDGGPVQDIDCHVVLNECLTNSERDNIQSIHKKLARKYPPLGGELDAYFILIDAAKGTERPQHLLNLAKFDNSWALHCAHVRAGRYEILYGPEPRELFPAPSWGDVSSALRHELAFVQSHLRYPAYCVLNLCRIISSYSDGNPVKSKHGSGIWAYGKFPEWKPLIQAAIRDYANEATQRDKRLLTGKLSAFLAFAERLIDDAKAK